jgi:hypothetical protein
MSKKTIGILLAAFGAVIAVISLFADIIGIGRDPGIHGAQVLGIVIGLIVAAVGVWLAMSQPAQKQ